MSRFGATLITGVAVANLAWLNIGLAPAALSDDGANKAVTSFAKVTEPQPVKDGRPPSNTQMTRNAVPAIEDTTQKALAARAIEDATQKAPAAHVEEDATQKMPAARADEVVAVEGALPSCSAGATISRRIHFARASIEIDEAAAARLDAVVTRVRALSDINTRLVLDGHTDRRGEETTNDELGERRARAVSDYIRARGFDGDTAIRSFGARRPIAAPTPSTRWRNRRVVVCVLEVSPR